MPKKALFYSLKVWITGVILGPLCFYVIDKNEFDGLLSFPEYALIFLVGGLLFSVPSFLLLWATTNYICKHPGDQLLQRLKLAAWCLLFTALPLAIVIVLQHTPPDSADWPKIISFIAGYFAPIAAAIFFYHLPSAPAADGPTPTLNSSPD